MFLLFCSIIICAFILFLLFFGSPTLRDSKMNDLRPIVEELTLLDEQRNQFKDRISQVSRLKKEQKNAVLTASISFIKFYLKLSVCIAVGCRDCRLQ